MEEKRYFVAYKPYGILTKFTDAEGRPTLARLGFAFPGDVYPVGRLDMDSEGLLLLANDRGLTHALLDPGFRHEREYHVQVEGEPSREALVALERGVTIEGRRTLPASARRLVPPPDFPERDPPIRERRSIPTAWISLTLVEGRNRQVRRMTAAVGHPTLRLVRVRIEGLTLGAMKPAEVRALAPAEVRDLREAVRRGFQARSGPGPRRETR